VQVVPEETIDEDGLALEIIPEGCCPQARMEEATNLVKLVHQLVTPHVVEIALGCNEIDGPTVLSGDFGHEEVRAPHGIFVLGAIDKFDEH